MAGEKSMRVKSRRPADDYHASWPATYNGMVV
jgi:hypothetical protein